MSVDTESIVTGVTQSMSERELWDRYVGYQEWPEMPAEKENPPKTPRELFDDAYTKISSEGGTLDDLRQLARLGQEVAKTHKPSEDLIYWQTLQYRADVQRDYSNRQFLHYSNRILEVQKDPNVSAETLDSLKTGEKHWEEMRNQVIAVMEGKRG